MRASRENHRNRARRRDKGFGHRLVLTALLAIAAATLLAWGIRALLFGTSLFTLTEVRVQGARLLSRDQLAELAGVHAGQNLLTLNQRLLERRLATVPRIKSAQVVKEYPHTVILRIEERTPLLMVQDAGAIAVDEDGTLFVSTGKEREAGIPRLAGVPPDLAAPGRLIGEVRQIAPLLREMVPLRPVLESVDMVCLGGKGEVSFLMGNGGASLLWGEGGYGRKLDCLKRVLQEGGITAKCAGEIDLRFRDEVVLRGGAAEPVIAPSDTPAHVSEREVVKTNAPG